MTQVKCTSEHEQNQNTTAHLNLEPPDQDQIQNVSLFLRAGAPLHSAGAPFFILPLSLKHADSTTASISVSYCA